MARTQEVAFSSCCFFLWPDPVIILPDCEWRQSKMPLLREKWERAQRSYWNSSLAIKAFGLMISTKTPQERKILKSTRRCWCFLRTIVKSFWWQEYNFTRRNPCLWLCVCVFFKVKLKSILCSLQCILLAPKRSAVSLDAGLWMLSLIVIFISGETVLHLDVLFSSPIKWNLWMFAGKVCPEFLAS